VRPRSRPSQILGTDTDDEATQWAWLAAARSGSADRPVLLFLHKPLFQDSAADEAAHQRYVPVAARRKLLDLFPAGRLRAVVSGHVHQYRDRVVDGARHLWVPSTAFFLPDELQDRIGEKVTGVGMIELAPDQLRFHLVCPEGVIRHSALDHPVYPKLVEARAPRPRRRTEQVTDRSSPRYREALARAIHECVSRVRPTPSP